MMEPHQHNYELTAASSLTSHQLEVYRLYQMCGVNMTNDKFKVTLQEVGMIKAISKIYKLSGHLAACLAKHTNLLHNGFIKGHFATILSIYCKKAINDAFL